MNIPKTFPGNHVKLCLQIWLPSITKIEHFKRRIWKNSKYIFRHSDNIVFMSLSHFPWYLIISFLTFVMSIGIIYQAYVDICILILPCCREILVFFLTFILFLCWHVFLIYWLTLCKDMFFFAVITYFLYLTLILFSFHLLSYRFSIA